MLPTARFSSLALVGAVLIAGPLVAQDGAATTRTTADSSFTDPQAERGGTVFARVCLECHARLDMANNDFRLKWSGQSTFELFKSIVTTMPDNNPGGLPRSDYTDVVAYILKLNGVPAGPIEMADDSASMSRARMNLPSSPSGQGALARATSALLGRHTDALRPHAWRK